MPCPLDEAANAVRGERRIESSEAHCGSELSLEGMTQEKDRTGYWRPVFSLARLLANYRPERSAVLAVCVPICGGDKHG
jgi:hypothetical protein